MAGGHDDDFFIGWARRLPPRLGLALAVMAGALLGAAAGLAFALGASLEDPGDAHFAFDLGRQNLAGSLRLDPYPVLHLPAAPGRPAHAVLLVGQGKHGVAGQAAALAGKPAAASGILLKRGAIDMLQVAPGSLRALAQGADAVPPGFVPAAAVALGRWRLVGEICDGKCTQGAMRPGRGLAHKACANLCLAGGAPPVFISAGPVDGQTYFLLAGPDGGPLPVLHRDLVALWIELEGEVERRDDLLVFKVDLDRARVL